MLPNMKCLSALLAAATLLSTASAIASPSPNGNAKCEVGSAWRDTHDCHAFFECAAGGIPVRKLCGPRTAYSPHIGICDYEWKVPTCRNRGSGHGHGQGRHGDEEEEEKGEEEKEKEEKEKEEKGWDSHHNDHDEEEKGDDDEKHDWQNKAKAEKRQDEEEERENTSGLAERDTDRGEKTNAYEKCRVGTPAWADTTDCHKFWECAAGGIPVRKTCGPGTAYSEKLGVCDFEWRVGSCRRHRHNEGWETKPHGQSEEEGDRKWEHKGSSRGGDEKHQEWDGRH